MWARIVEVILALFLSISSFIFPFKKPLWMFNIIIALWVLFFSFLSFYPKLSKIHLMNLFAIFTLLGVAFVQPNPPPAAPYQNYVVIALLMFLFTIIPSKASIPPKSWREFNR